MKILYYVPDITQKNGGVLQYACALLKILAKDENNQYFILHNLYEPVILSIIEDHSNLTLIPVKVGRERKVEKLLWYTLSLINKLLIKVGVLTNIKVFSHTEQLCKRYNIDILCCPYQHLPSTSRKTIVTLHDVQELHFPEFFSPKERLARTLQHNIIAEGSSLIVVSYEHVKEDLIKYFQRPADSILVCLLDMQNLWFDKFLPEHRMSLASYKLPDKFVFYPAVTWPHKNHISLIQAIAYLRDTHNININVVFSGHTTEYYEKIKDEVSKIDISDQVHFLGVVNEQVLYSLYHAAQAVVVPTTYEAGSFPLMESILMGIPVICSNVTSLPETIGDKNYIFPPNNIPEIADKIRKIFFDQQYRENNLENSQKQARKLRNTNALTKFTQAIADLSSSS
ncbi:glycosyltransferase family 4 protein [Spirosoma fluviale]|uniref:Glycosyltransferase involved in cell wall bisynthesis n=1 Tax=Spirosoma fluviale TaxID=1597977 RepID=A0A286GHU5_9BACT|nr:glycosyltransferase family 1 protein [Spirosoma fluviale]SOD95103.1 Glycosyltransferase involved in cell wall bisynthesis [Spirosoma fluviale]